MRGISDVSILSVSQNGDVSVDFYTKAESSDVATYLYDLVLTYHEKGYRKIVIVLDNCPSHKAKMRLLLSEKMKLNPQLSQIEVEFINTPAYSPDFNLAEYLIHQLRFQLLHHLPSNTTLDEVIQKIKSFLQEKSLQTPRQIKNTINHILKLGQLPLKLEPSTPFTPRAPKAAFLTNCSILTESLLKKLFDTINSPNFDVKWKSGNPN